MGQRGVRVDVILAPVDQFTPATAAFFGQISGEQQAQMPCIIIAGISQHDLTDQAGRQRPGGKAAFVGKAVDIAQ